jgi:hypothetical protein
MPRKFEERYQRTLRKRLVKKYVKENKRSPSRAQVNELMQRGALQYPNLDSVGFSSVDLIDREPRFMSESSAEDENVFRDSAYDDLVSINGKIEDLAELIEVGQRSFKATSARVKKLLRKIDRRLNNLLILSGRTDVFVYGVEESFDTHDAVDMELTDASVEAGYVTIGRSGYTKVDLTDAMLSVKPNSDKGIVGTANISGLASLKEIDGDIWEYQVVTNYPTGRVSIAIDIDFRDPKGQYVGDIRLTGNSIDSNSLTEMTVRYSIDGKTYRLAPVGTVEFGTGENQISLGVDKVQKLRIILTKNAADHKDSNSRYRYMFAADALEIFTDKYDTTKDSTLILGPYKVLDESGYPVNFTMATLGSDTCCILPRKTSVSFFLSKDKTNWFPASFNEESLSVVYFNTSNPVGTYAYINSTENADALFDEPPTNVDLSIGKELICNLYISEDYSDSFILRNTYVKRNLPQDGLSLYGVSSGWFFDGNQQQYTCGFKVEDIQGRFLDFGNTSAYIDGRLVTGKVHVSEGYHSFATSHSNWHDIPEGITNHTDLEEQDPVYPFNHKLIIEGYKYPSNFAGARVYEGVDEYFGSLLEYVSPEEFEEEENDGNLHIYTVESYDGRLYFKVKADSADGSWALERTKVEYMLRTEDTSDLYIKAVINTKDETVTPNIHSVNVRVV